MHNIIDFLGIIPARKNSKGLKRKNTIKVKNKTLIEYTLIAASNTKLINKSFVTSDDKKILKIASRYKKILTHLRPNNLALDNTNMKEVIVNLLKSIKKKYNLVIKNFVVLQPTSPLRNSKDITKAIKTFKKLKCKSLVSVSETFQHPNEMFFIDKNKKKIKIIKKHKEENRQNFKKCVFVNGAIYVSNTEHFLKNKKFLTNKTEFFFMDKKNSIDIDESFDLKIAEVFIK